DQERAFDRFARLDGARSRDGDEAGGAGLGLAIVRATAQAYGGTAHLEPAVSAAHPPGLRAVVRLPPATLFRYVTFPRVKVEAQAARRHVGRTSVSAGSIAVISPGSLVMTGCPRSLAQMATLTSTMSAVRVAAHRAPTRSAILASSGTTNVLDARSK